MGADMAIKQMGSLESKVMEIVWRKGRMSVREVYEILASNREVAYTTVLTVMQRLSEKGLLARIVEGRSHIYAPTFTREEYFTTLFGSFLSELGQSAAARTLVHFVDETEDDELLAELERLIHERRTAH